ncbi:Peptidyl-prolyl cis-trans isomerase CWC27 like protein [Eufriesea mexicana]|uniref:Spliceosome-associated protein CWC27 homolog n=1 Tax=Eufriesea mexicana TaxID=516756 RepID=A0A310SDI1_9HYME|nr:Peptidyl-prolyl cis-trans isomerase CWC27 like protein [Eufriesea mexicana]
MKTTVGDVELELWAKETAKACRNFIPLCTGQGGKIYGEPFKEFHTRLRFCRRDLMAMANAGKDDNGSQFFFTLSSTPDLQNKHTIFGKVTGETIYITLKLEEAFVDEKREEVKDSSKTKTASVKDFNLLSFGEEAEEDEVESVKLNKEIGGKSKSAHDHLTDPKLSSQQAVEPPGLTSKRRTENRNSY